MEAPMSTDISVEELRHIMITKYPDGKEKKTPVTAVGVVLLAAGQHGITAPGKLVELTGYTQNFISAIIFNLQNNKLWEGGRYDASSWLAPDGAVTDCEFWDHIAAASGELWFPAGDANLGINACEIFWADERRRSSGNAQSGVDGITGTPSMVQQDLSSPPLGRSNHDSSRRSSKIDWKNLRCDLCKNAADSVCVDDSWPDDEPIIHLAYCEDHFAVNVAGTVWLHWEESD
jgi:hypothetical protein